MKKSTFITLSEVEFEQQFTLIKNHLNPNAGWEGCYFETFGEELDFILNQPHCHVWTLLDGDEGKLCLISGFHFVNRVNYLLTHQSVPENIEFIIELE